MRIGFDRQTFTIQKFGGISRYFTDLYLGLLEEPKIDAELLFNHHQNAYLEDGGVGKTMHPLAATFYTHAMLKGNFRVPLAKNQDIHHSTYYLGRPQKRNQSLKLVSTLYDMIPELLPKFFKKNPHANKLEWLEASDLIISISDSSASDLAYFRPDLARRIRRIHLYSGFTCQSPHTKPLNMKGNISDYVLFIGNRGGYKNATMLIRAFAASNPSQHGHQLIFAGGGTFNQQELATIDQLRITNYVKQLSVNDAELWHLYLNTKAVLVPSMAEGFSLPLVEGLIADVPVVCSDIPVHREVAKTFATLVNPLQHNDWENILNSITSLKNPTELLGKDSFNNLCEYFSKQRMVQEHVQAYSDLTA